MNLLHTHYTRKLPLQMQMSRIFSDLFLTRHFVKNFLFFVCNFRVSQVQLMKAKQNIRYTGGILKCFISCLNALFFPSPHFCSPDVNNCIPPTIPHAKYTSSLTGWYEDGYVIRITCDPGYSSKDWDATTQCVNGKWLSVPICQRKSLPFLFFPLNEYLFLFCT